MCRQYQLCLNQSKNQSKKKIEQERELERVGLLEKVRHMSDLVLEFFARSTSDAQRQALRERMLEEANENVEYRRVQKTRKRRVFATSLLLMALLCFVYSPMLGTNYAADSTEPAYSYEESEPVLFRSSR